MKAAVVTRYGPPEVVELRELPDPRPRPGEVLVGVHVSTVTAADWRIRSGTVPRGFGPLLRLALGWRAPRHAVLGVEMAGEVLALGRGVSRFALGDRLILDTVGNCPYARGRPALAVGGRLLLVATDLMGTLGALARPRRAAGHRVVAGVDSERREVLEMLMDLAARGILTPPIDRRFPLGEIQAAHAYIETRRKRGSVLVNIA